MGGTAVPLFIPSPHQGRGTAVIPHTTQKSTAVGRYGRAVNNYTAAGRAMAVLYQQFWVIIC
ncbi:MAG TPA: hypothetical protein PLD25_09995 [Chloroflexota bacterium]|nr:hypothetical protein [Chloroflexota bacterium]